MTTEQKKNVRKWVKALRSGKFKQGQYYLHNTARNSYCCLGVACKAIELKFDDGGIIDGRCGFLSSNIKNKFGLTTGEGTYDNNARHGLNSLTDDNDNRNLSFTEIADIIESRPSGLFMD